MNHWPTLALHAMRNGRGFRTDQRGWIPGLARVAWCTFPRFER